MLQDTPGESAETMTHEKQQGSAGGRRERSTLVGDERGLSTIEYVIILVLVAAVGIGTWTVFGRSVKCALGIANDTIGAGIGVEGQIGPQACAKGVPSQDGNSPGVVGGEKPAAEAPEHKKKKRVN
jgi:Flp pilus assembly pilin Flp